MLTIWGGLKSNNVQKVVWAAEELGVEYTLVPAGMEYGNTDTPEFRARNPNGLVPVIDDNGFVLWESNAIVRYLGARYGDMYFYPTDLQERALADRWMDWASLQFYPALRPAFFQLVRTDVPNRNPVLIEESLAKTETCAAILDQHLADKEFANGPHFSMADICLAVIAHRWMGLPATRKPRPHFERWFQSVRERKTAKKLLVLPLR